MGSRKASTAQEASSSRARRAGGTSLCRESTQKFSILRRRAVSRVAATVGAVVSKPMPRKTTMSLGLAVARVRASRGE